MRSIANVFLALRPKQWVKNVFLFAALFFARRFTDPTALLHAATAFAAFCLVSGAVYLMNDVTDREKDRLHPKKKLRPIAAGKVSVPTAIGASIGTACAGLALAWTIRPAFLHLTLFYALMNVAYSFYLKKIVILDVMIIAFGFVIRAYGGAVAIDAPFSSWLLLCTIMLSLFLAFCKRRGELASLGKGAEKHRSILLHYSPAFLDQMISVTTASTVMSYALYTSSPETVKRFGTDSLQFTLPFVLFGIFRYLYLVHQRQRGGDPTTAVLSDGPLLVNVLLWALSCAWILYG